MIGRMLILIKISIDLSVKIAFQTSLFSSKMQQKNSHSKISIIKLKIIYFQSFGSLVDLITLLCWKTKKNIKICEIYNCSTNYRLK